MKFGKTQKFQFDPNFADKNYLQTCGGIANLFLGEFTDEEVAAEKHLNLISLIENREIRLREATTKANDDPRWWVKIVAS